MRKVIWLFNVLGTILDHLSTKKNRSIYTKIQIFQPFSGAGHIHRFLSMDQNLLQRTADDVSESITSVSQAFNTLEEASTQLGQIVTQKFDEAVAKDDLASVERFFKIFPLLGNHSEGIAKFANYICSKVSICNAFDKNNQIIVYTIAPFTVNSLCGTLPTTYT